VILAVDTTAEHGSLALVHDGRTLEELALHAPTGFAHVLYEALRALLDRNAVRLTDIDCFAAASGPGSFTGVRIGLAAVKGLAAALDKPAVAVSNLQALATFGTESLRAAVIDARRGEIYGAVYDAEGKVVLPEMVTKLDSWLATIPPAAQFISPAFPEGVPEPRIQAPTELAGAIARIAESRPWQDPAALDANYVRRSDAELFWKEC
jgi:tRNA threonylcarbamoyladenosine biosynthesis protein TsaB